MFKLKDLLVSVFQNRELKNAKTYKNAQGASSMIAAIIGALIVLFPSVELTQEAIHVISLGIAYVAQVALGFAPVSGEMAKAWVAGLATLFIAGINAYITYASSKKVGLPTRVEKEVQSVEEWPYEQDDFDAEVGVDSMVDDADIVHELQLPQRERRNAPLRDTGAAENSVNAGGKGLLGRDT